MTARQDDRAIRTCGSASRDGSRKFPGEERMPVTRKRGGHFPFLGCVPPLLRGVTGGPFGGSRCHHPCATAAKSSRGTPTCTLPRRRPGPSSGTSILGRCGSLPRPPLLGRPSPGKHSCEGNQCCPQRHPGEGRGRVVMIQIGCPTPNGPGLRRGDGGVAKVSPTRTKKGQVTPPLLLFPKPAGRSPPAPLTRPACAARTAGCRR